MSSQGQSAQIVSKFDAIVFPADERPPRVVQLMTTTLPGPILNPSPPYRCGQMPHPEVFMDYIAENLGHRAWKFVVRTSSYIKHRTSRLLVPRPSVHIIHLIDFVSRSSKPSTTCTPPLITHSSSSTRQYHGMACHSRSTNACVKFRMRVELTSRPKRGAERSLSQSTKTQTFPPWPMLPWPILPF